MRKYPFDKMKLGEVHFLKAVKLKTFEKFKHAIWRWNSIHERKLEYRVLGGGVEIRRIV